MTEDYADKVIRLLDIIDRVVSGDESYPEKYLPFTVNHEGTVQFDEKISKELSKPENSDLVTWAHENVVALFE